jgi:hypothetical protein
VVDRDAVLGTVAASNGGVKLLLQVPFGVVIFRKDDDAGVMPHRPGLSQGGTHVLAHPGEELTDSRIGASTGRLSNLGHSVEQVLFAGK